jgi:tyrosyl-tRNA synthetase
LNTNNNSGQNNALSIAGDAFAALAERGFTKQCNDLPGLQAALKSARQTFYIGFDPTASSLHCGSLMPIMAMAHLQRAGHRPIGLIGGGTCMIGDPSGKTEMRQMMTYEQIQANGQGILSQLQRYLKLAEPGTPGSEAGLFLNNADWLMKLNYIAFLRDVGRYFKVNEMVRADAYRARLEREEGLSFIEFNYQLLQGFDFLHLFEQHGCSLQMGGDDQWSNCLAGADLVRKKHSKPAFVLTLPLLTTARGEKMGKTAAGAVWLDAARTSPYDFYQYWINTDDRDVERFLAFFTFMPMDEVKRLGQAKGAELNVSKRILAHAVTTLCHGQAAADEAKAAAEAAFGGGDAAAMPSFTLPLARLGAGVSATDLFAEVFGMSKSDARRLVEQGGATVNDAALSDPKAMVDAGSLKDGAMVLKAGKKRVMRVVAQS